MSSIISDAERLRSNQPVSRKLGYAAERIPTAYERPFHSFGGNGTVSLERLEKMIKESGYFRNKKNW